MFARLRAPLLPSTPRRVRSRRFLSSSSDSVSPTPTSFVSHLKSCKSLRQLKQIHARVFRAGLEQHENVLNKLVAFCADPCRGDLRHAERVLGHAIDPSLFVYNVVIKALAKRGELGKAVSVFRKLRERGVSPDNFTYPYVLKAIGRLGAVDEGEKVHGYVVKSGLEFDAYVCNSLMDMYAEFGRTASMERVFDEMPERDVVSWNVVISGYVRCRRFDDAVGIFERMLVESNARPDEATVVSTLSACTALKSLELGMDIHDYVNKELICTSIIGNALLDMYSKCGHLDVARKIFDEMPTKNVICWTSMISGYVNCGQLDEARELFDRSPVKDIVLWTAMINGYVQFNRFDEAINLFQELQVRGIKPDKFTTVALLTGCAQCGALEQGKWIHRYIDEHGIQLDAVVGTALIDMYAKCGCIDKALDIFYRLRIHDTASWTAIICGLAMNGRTGEALNLFIEMRDHGFKPDDVTFIGVLSACSHGGLVKEGRRLFSLMTETYGIEPKVEHYGCMIDLLGRVGLLDEAEKLIEKVPNENDEIAIPLYGALLSACRLHSNINIGERMAKRLVKMEFNDSSIHTLLANTYASANRWADVARVRSKMEDLGIKKTPGCSSIEVNGIIHEFTVGGPSSPEMYDICFMLDKMMDLLVGSEESKMGEEDVVTLSF
ncbi:pentatricopeptide repeat-containing protein At1g31430 [Syzygium oleosum]|uniref:pentatricopeptide repeat-containing protein At1g31430 n=1 Tax=Syzygium oleosum TaxID=219896 RepID=UPI0024B8F43A|nr:pentatricopeptide repeat-containing protein At1g31430 [Syzygium oleosum]